MSNLPPIIPDSDCAVHNQPVAVAMPTLLRTADQGDPNIHEMAKAELLFEFVPTPSNSFIIRAIADGAAGNAVAFEIAAPASSFMTSVSDPGDGPIVIPGTRARMIVTGSSPTFNGTYRYAGDYPGTTRAYWKKIDTGASNIILAFPYPDTHVIAGDWQFRLNDVTHYKCTVPSYDAITQPQGLVFTATGPGVPGTPPVVVADVSDTQQVINAINIDPEAHSIIEALSLGGPNTADTMVVPRQFLEGGLDASSGAVPLGIGQLCRVGPYPLDPPRTEEYDWFIAETMDYWRQIFI